MLHLEPWQPETARTVTMPFAWKPDTWYRLKLQVENLPDGKDARARQSLAGQRNRTSRLDDRTHRPDSQSPGRAGNFRQRLAELYFDNLKVYANK